MHRSSTIYCVAEESLLNSLGVLVEHSMAWLITIPGMMYIFYILFGTYFSHRPLFGGQSGVSAFGGAGGSISDC
jgi:hypothetical protein